MDIPEAKTMKDYLDAVDFLIGVKDDQIINMERERQQLVKMRIEIARQLTERINDGNKEKFH